MTSHVRYGYQSAIFGRILFDFFEKYIALHSNLDDLVEKGIALHSNWDDSVDDVIVRFIIPEKDEKCALNLRNRPEESGR